MDNYNNYNNNQGSNQNPRNPYSGDPYQNQGYGQNQGYNQNQGYGQNQGYNQNQGYGQNQGYTQNPYGQNYNQGNPNNYQSNNSYYNSQNQGYEQNPYGQNYNQGYNQNNYQSNNSYYNNQNQRYNYSAKFNNYQPRVNSYGNPQNNQKSAKGCIISLIVFVIVAAIGMPIVFRLIAEKQLRDWEQEYSQNTTEYGSTTESTTSDYTSKTTEATTEAATESSSGSSSYTGDDADVHGLSADDPATTMDEVVDAFVALIKSGEEGYVTIHISGLTTDDLITINSYPKITQYAISEQHSTTLIGTSGTVTYYFTINDAYYVERYYLEGVDIPDDKTKSKELYEAVEEFNSTYMTAGMTDYDKELAIHDFLVDNVTYGNKNVLIDDEHEAYGALVDHSAVCEGYAKAFDLLCTVNDIECIYITGEAHEPHGWNMVKLNGVWYHVDCTWDDPVDFGNTTDTTFADYTSHAYFNVSDEVLEQDGHTWDKDDYPSASSMVMNYYYVNGTLAGDYDTFVSELTANAWSGNTVELAVLDFDESTYDIQSIVETTSFYGSYYWSYARGDVDGYQVITITFN